MPRNDESRPAGSFRDVPDLSTRKVARARHGSQLFALTPRQRRALSARTKAGLAAKREREPDWKPGRPSEIPEPIRALIFELRQAGWKLREIAEFLDAAKVPTVHGGPWRTSTVGRVLGTQTSLPPIVEEAISDHEATAQPRLIIEIVAGRRPHVRHETATEADDERLVRWVKSDPQRHALVRSALRQMTEKP